MFKKISCVKTQYEKIDRPVIDYEYQVELVTYNNYIVIDQDTLLDADGILMAPFVKDGKPVVTFKSKYSQWAKDGYPSRYTSEDDFINGHAFRGIEYYNVVEWYTNCKDFIIPSIKVNKNVSSYGLKHKVESFLKFKYDDDSFKMHHNYCSNGHLIKVLMEQGFTVFSANDHINCYFNINQSKLNLVDVNNYNYFKKTRDTLDSILLHHGMSYVTQELQDIIIAHLAKASNRVRFLKKLQTFIKVL